MRIQHNILAMNAYRNYNTNTSALAKNLEKLSSGYKINRAGDDAAGLAISEKMRAQITGLSAASKNVKDGISLVKTAEGAMQEIQDMLNRMDYLATQSANGTYQDEVDREALQKEVNQLNEEINRIAESANFNGIKLLDGTWDADAKVRAVNAAQKALDTANAALTEASKPVTVAPVYSQVDSKKLIDDGVVLDEVQPGSNPVVPGGASDINTNTVLETTAVTGTKPKFQVTLNGTNHVMSTDGTTANTGVIELKVDGTTISIDERDIKALYSDKTTGSKVTAEELAKVFEAKINASQTSDATAGVGAGITLQNGDFVGTTNNNLVWNVKADGDKLVFNLNADRTPSSQFANNLNEHYNVSMGAAATGGVPANPTTGEVAASKATFETGAITWTAAGGGAADGNSKATVTYTDKAGKEKTVDVDFVTSTDADTTAGNLVDALKANDDLKALFDVTYDSTTKKITMTAKEAGTGKGAVTNIALAATGGNEAGKDTAAIGTGTKTDALDAYVPGTTGYTNYGTVKVEPGTPAKPNQLANTVIDLSKIGIVDGTKITLGKTEYTFAVGKNSTAKGDNIIDLTKYDDVSAAGALEDAATQMSKIDNGIFSVGHSGTDGHVTIQQLEVDGKHVEEGKMTTMDDLMKYIKVENADPELTKKAQEAADAAQAEKKAAAEEQVAAAKKQMTAAESIEGGKALNLQIGDTSDDFNQLGVKIGSMKTAALGVDGLKIDTAETATAAIDTIKSAINYVSSVRGDLGAYQNRLEHTANNLSVMTENITDAESTIRDTDIAEEMMAYTKNNILVQSAQAMLAQANAVPQGVLQLLG